MELKEQELIKYTVWLNERRAQHVAPLQLSIVEDYMRHLEQVEIEGAIPFEITTDELGRPVFIDPQRYKPNDIITTK